METYAQVGTIRTVSDKENNYTIKRAQIHGHLAIGSQLFPGRCIRDGFFAADVASAQTGGEDEQFGPVVRAYLGYLRNEQGW